MAFGTGPIATENQFPCQTPVATNMKICAENRKHMRPQPLPPALRCRLPLRRHGWYRNSHGTCAPGGGRVAPSASPQWPGVMLTPPAALPSASRSQGPPSLATPGEGRGPWSRCEVGGGGGGLEDRLEGPGLSCPQCQREWVVNRICQVYVSNHVFQRFQTSCGACGGPCPWGLIRGGGPGREAQRSPPPPQLRWAAGPVRFG